MILALRSEGELAASERGCGFDLFVMFDLDLRFVGLVVVGGGAVTVGRSQVDPAGVLAGTASIGGHPPGPARAIAGSGAVRVSQCLVFKIRIGVGAERPYLVDGFAHELVIPFCFMVQCVSGEESRR